MFRAYKNANVLAKAVGGGVGLLAMSQIVANQPYLNDLVNSVVVDKGISPFPKLINNFTMLGSGVRSVTFVGFKVYGVGIYYNKSEESTLVRILRQSISSGSENGKDLLKQQLDNDEDSVKLLDQLITNHQYLIRISPVRNTDFNHLKDGFIKSILAHPLTSDQEKVNQGLDELREVFKGHKGSVPKDHLLLLTVNKKGQLSFTYENTSTKQTIEMGTVNEPIIAKLLLIGYLGHKKPLSQPLRSDCNEKWLELVSN